MKLVKEMGFKRCCRDSHSVGGGISAIECLDGKPDGFKSVGEKHQNLYFPKVRNKELIAKIKALPLVGNEEFNETIGFKEQFSDMCFHQRFGCKEFDGGYLISISDKCDYTPKSDMIEILASEYKKLNK
jgi:hypothetical protein